MELAVAGWNYELVAPLAIAAVAFAVYARLMAPAGSRLVQVRRSLAFWVLGLGAAAALVVVLGLGGGEASNSSSWSVAQVHKAVALAIGALVVSYLPFATVAVVSHGHPWRSQALYAAVLSALLVPLFAITPMLAAAGAILSCVLLQVQQCL
jgi:hypothetical protein